MLTPAEKRFISYWQDQREGGRWSYYILYIVVGTFIVTLILSIFLLLFFQITFGSLFFWLVFSSGLIISCAITITTWSRNEKRFKKIIRREVDEGELQDKESM